MSFSQLKVGLADQTTSGPNLDIEDDGVYDENSSLRVSLPHITIFSLLFLYFLNLLNTICIFLAEGGGLALTAQARAVLMARLGRQPDPPGGIFSFFF